MTLADQGKRLRAEIEGMDAGSGRRYSRAQRWRILGWVERAVRAGMTEHACATQLGISAKRLARWRLKEATPRKLVAVEVHDDAAPAPGVSFVAPSGYWIDGLTIDQAIALMRAFA